VYYCAVGEIHYDAVDGDAESGTLVYIKPGLTEQESADIFNYSRTSKAFPHESTTDQWFSEAQFESYRELGQWCVKRICDASRNDPHDLRGFVEAARQHCSDGPAITPEPKQDAELYDGWSFGPIPFTEENIARVPMLSGVFRLYDGDEIAYIGRDRQLVSRLRSHKIGKEGPLTQAACSFDCQVSTNALDREEELFKEFKAANKGALPKWNVL
jgi:hypothetical protein